MGPILLFKKNLKSKLSMKYKIGELDKDYLYYQLR